MIVKRLFDVAFSLLALVVLAPLLLVIAVAIKLSGPGPVFFRQERVGRGGRTFRIWKFRTMVADAPDKGAQITAAGDARITRAGRLLRRFKLDELPQFINVFVGEMSIAGPRPEVSRYVAMYNDRQRRVLSARPGMTDYASIAYADEERLLASAEDSESMYVNEVMPHKLELNLKYIDERSLWVDIKLIVKTFARVVGLG